MGAIDIQELYDSDPRPTFVVDCHARPAAICHINTALLEIPHVAQSLHNHDAFRDWWDPASKVAARHRKEFRHGRSRWTKFTACKRWLVVSLIERLPRPDESRSQRQGSCSQQQEPAQSLQGTLTLQKEVETIFTAKIQSCELREHIDHIRTVDWAATSLGPIDSWSYELNTLIMTLMLETRPTALFLGPEHTIVYNLAYAAVSGSRHPHILGKSIIDAWPELADPVSATVARSQQTRFADAPEDEYHFMIERDGFVEESFFLWSLVPLGGLIDGMYSIVTEVTKQRLLERRVSAILRVGQLSSEARDKGTFWTSLFEAVKPYEYDFPTAILFSSDSGKSAMRKCKLEWTIGYSDDHPAIPKDLSLDQDYSLARAILESSKGGTVTLFRQDDGVLPDSLYKDIEHRGFGDPCRALIIIPITIYDDSISGFLIMSLNTRRPYDAEYQEWIEVFSNLLGTSAASVALYEEEVRNRKRQEEEAAKDHKALSAEVAVLTQEASDVAEKLQNLHDIANGVGLGYFEFDIDGRLMYANEAFFTQTQHRRDLANAPPFSFLEYVYEPDVDVAMEHWKKSVGGAQATFELRWKKVNAQLENDDSRDYLWTLSNCTPITSEQGLVTGICGCNTDITAQKEAERAAILRMEAERRFANFTELAPVGFYQLDANLTIEYCNEQWFQITNHPRVPVKEIDWKSLIFEEDLKDVHEELTMILRKQGSHTFSFRIKRQWRGPDGILTPTWLMATACTYLDKEGNTTSITGTMNDISHLKWAEAVQRNRVEEALESKRQQENFIDMTSHEMRNPLSAMVQCADTISSSLSEMAALTSKETQTGQMTTRTVLEDLIETSLNAVETIQVCATHQKRIVDDILTLSKLDSKLLVISPIVVRPSVLLRDVHKMFKEEAAKARVTLEVQCDPSIAELDIDHAILDPSRVLQILINLLTNAIKFTQDQPIRKVNILMSASADVAQRPEVEYVPQEEWRERLSNENKPDDGNTFYLHFTVKDTGCGLSAEHKAKLFLRFSQASPKTHVQYGGSGLGLFISRELTEMQGGSIGVQSTQGVGSTFSFYIRSQRAAAPGADAASLSLLQRPRQQSINATDYRISGGPSSSQQDSKYHILVVEDNLINQRVLCNQLKKMGCTVQVANHGGEALDELSKTTYYKEPTIPSPFELSVVLLDVEMPIMDGLTCARKIRELQEKGDIVGHVPIIAVSANARREQVDQARQSGMDDAISKPFRIPELMATIGGLLSRNIQ